MIAARPAFPRRQREDLFRRAGFPTRPSRNSTERKSAPPFAQRIQSPLPGRFDVSYHQPADVNILSTIDKNVMSW